MAINPEFAERLKRFLDEAGWECVTVKLHTEPPPEPEPGPLVFTSDSDATWADIEPIYIRLP